jgi:hypothetical protein
METVKNFVITVTAYLVLVVYESVMDILLLYEFGKDRVVLGQNGSQTLKLRRFLSINPYPVSILKVLSYVFGKKFEVLAANGLRNYAELDNLLVLS